MNNKIVALVVAVVLVIAGMYFFSSDKPTVSAQGVSSIDVTPDLVSVYVTIETKDAKAEIAQNLNTVAKDKFIENLKKIGLYEQEALMYSAYQDFDVQLVSFSINPNYDWRTGRQEGFVARQEVLVKVKEVDVVYVPAIVDAAVDAGASVSYVSFELSPQKQSEYKIQALKEAGEDARKKADATASGLGKKLGSLVSVNSEEFSYQPYPYYAKAEDSPAGTAGAEAREAVASIAVAPRDLQVSATVNVVYKLTGF